MKKVLFLVLAVLCLAAPALADQVMLQNTETLAVPTSAKLDWKITLIDATTKTLHVTYQWRDAGNNPIRISVGETWKTWVCQDRPPQLVASCVAPGEPYPCCTDPGTGVGCDPGNDCFTSIFAFTIRSQDVGTKIGVGLRTLIWNKFRADILSSNNTGTFDAN